MAPRTPLRLTDALRRGEPASRRYGRLDSTPMPIASMVGRIDTRFTIYPPGTNRREAELLHIAALGSTWLGIMAVLLLFLLLSITVNVGAGIAAAIALVGLWLLLMGRSARLRRQSIVLRGSTKARVDPKHRGEIANGQANYSPTLTSTIQAFDELDARDDLDSIAYELEWGRIYNTAKGDHA